MAETGLSAVEAELYDRQIRLWGIESQEKLRAANVLLIGVRVLGAEIAKNILLSGINSLTILDGGVVTEQDLQKNFLLDSDSLGKKIADSVLIKAQALNPLVKLTVDDNALSSKDASFYNKFTIIIGTSLQSQEIITISKICRENKIKFICGEAFGMFGYSLSDFQEHTYFEEIPKMLPTKKRTHDETKPKYEKVLVKEQGTMVYPNLSNVLNTAETVPKAKRRNHLYYLLLALMKFKAENTRNPLENTKSEDNKKLIEYKDEILKVHQVTKWNINEEITDLIYGDIVPICSIVGGVIAQEVIKAVSGKEVPIHNVFLMDPFTYNGREDLIGA